MSYIIRPDDGPESSETFYPLEEYVLRIIADSVGDFIAGYSDRHLNNYADRALNIYRTDSGDNILWTTSLPYFLQQSSQIIFHPTSGVVGDGLGGITITSIVIAGGKDASVAIQHIDTSGKEVFDVGTRNLMSIDMDLENGNSSSTSGTIGEASQGPLDVARKRDIFGSKNL